MLLIYLITLFQYLKKENYVNFNINDKNNSAIVR